MAVNNMSKSQSVYNLIKQGLNASSLRSKVIANNIANVNTKGYKKFYVTFEETLKNTTGSEELKTTDARHITVGEGNGSINVKQDTSTSLRQDGNNVDIDSEMTNQAANNMMYNALITQVNSRISLERYVINEGRR